MKTFLFILSSLAISVFSVKGQPISLLKDINIGQSSSNPSSFFSIDNNHWIFVADDGISGEELWITDGSINGTTLLYDIYPGPQKSNISSFTKINGHVLFLANDGIHGEEFWTTDGTSNGTYLLMDICVGSYGPFDGYYFKKAWEKNGKTYFLANDFVHGLELWYSDGTSSGTSLLKDINPGVASAFLHPLQDSLFYEFQNSIYFAANDGVHGDEAWKSDGNFSGTQILCDCNVGPLGAFYGVSTTFVMRLVQNGTFCFLAENDLASPDNALSLFVSNGDSSGTFIISDLNYPNSLASGVELNGLMYFIGGRGTGSRHELWRTDGTTGGTFLVKDIDEDSLTSSFGNNFGPTFSIGNKFYFLANNNQIGQEIWSTDGSFIGTQLLYDIFPGTGDCNCSDFVTYQSNCIFMANDSMNGTELWITDGSTNGTYLLKDINPGVYNSISIFEPHSFNNKLYFTATQLTTGSEFWSTDGTTAGTQLVKDINTGPTSTTYSYIINVNNTMLFKANSTLYGEEFYRSDGTSNGTYILKDINQGPNSSTPYWLSKRINDTWESPLTINNNMIFSASSLSTSDFELWQTDGTTSGTFEIQDLNPGTNGSNPSDFLYTPFGYIFEAKVDTVGKELWSIDTLLISNQIRDNVQKNGIIAFPNPSTIGSQICLKSISLKNIQQIELQDLLGRKLPPCQALQFDSEICFSNSNLSKGAYILSIIFDDKSNSRVKLIIN